MDFRRSFTCFLVLFAFFCATAKAEELFAPVVLEQEPLPGAVASSANPVIRVRFQDAGKNLKKENLLIEVDRNDVSPFVQFDGDTFTYQPSAELKPGNHEIRISGTSISGRKLQDVIWSFSVPQTATAPAWSAGLEPTLSLEYRLRRDAISSDPHKVSSSIILTSQRSGPIQSNFSTTLQAQEPIPGNTPYEMDLANYIFNISSGQTSAAVGDVVVNYDFLGVTNLARRGVVFQQKLPFLTSGLDVFSVRSETIFGFRHGLGFSDSQQRVDGGSFFFSPVSNPESLLLRLYYMNGENASEQGFNFGGITRGSKGRAIGLGFGSSFKKSEMRLEGSLAWSDFDFNGSDDVSGNSDHGIQLKLTWDPSPRMWKQRSSKLFTQIEFQDIGTFFKTLGNPFLVGDRLGWNANTTWTYGILSTTGGLSWFHDNVKDLRFIPRVDNLSYTAGFSVTPVGAEGPPKWPATSFTYARTSQESVRDPVAFLAIDANTDTFVSTLALTRNQWNALLNASFTAIKDRNHRVPDTDSTTITLTGFLTPLPQWSIGPSLSFMHQTNSVTNVSTNFWTPTLSFGIPLLPQTITLDGQASYSFNQTSDSLIRNSNFSGTAQLLWHFNSILRTRSNQSVGLKISYNRIVSQAPFFSNFQRGFEIYAVMNLSWPISGR